MVDSFYVFLKKNAAILWRIFFLSIFVGVILSFIFHFLIFEKNNCQSIVLYFFLAFASCKFFLLLMIIVPQYLFSQKRKEIFSQGIMVSYITKLNLEKTYLKNDNSYVEESLKGMIGTYLVYIRLNLNVKTKVVFTFRLKWKPLSEIEIEDFRKDLAVYNGKLGIGCINIAFNLDEMNDINYVVDRILNVTTLLKNNNFSPDLDIDENRYFD